MLRDKHIDWIRARKFYDIFSMNGLTSFEVKTQDVGEIIGVPGVEDNHLLQVNDTGCIGLVLGTLNKGITCTVVLPYDIDGQYPLGIRFLFTQSADALTDCYIDWDCYWAVVRMNETISDPATALNVPIVATEVSSSAWVTQWTSRGIIDEDYHLISRDTLESGALLMIILHLKAITAGITDVTLLGMELDYAPQRTLGDGNLSDPPLVI